MSMSLRDQLLQAGLISQKQARDAERQQQQQREQRRPPAPRRSERAAQRPAPSAAVAATAAPTSAAPTSAALSGVGPATRAAKVARDIDLNRRQQEKARRKALQAEIKQLIAQHRVPSGEGDAPYNFLDGTKIRSMYVGSAARQPLSRGELVIVRSEGRYDLVSPAIAARIRERDASAVIASSASAPDSEVDAAYEKFTVPDDLIW